MKFRTSKLHGRLENEVEDFVATLLCEFGYDVKSMIITYYDDQEDEEVIHTFINPDTDSSFEEKILATEQ